MALRTGIFSATVVGAINPKGSQRAKVVAARYFWPIYARLYIDTARPSITFSFSLGLDAVWDRSLAKQTASKS